MDASPPYAGRDDETTSICRHRQRCACGIAEARYKGNQYRVKALTWKRTAHVLASRRSARLCRAAHCRCTYVYARMCVCVCAPLSLFFSFSSCPLPLFSLSSIDLVSIDVTYFQSLVHAYRALNFTTLECCKTSANEKKRRGRSRRA